MPREIGDYEFNRMFPDQNKPAPPPRPPSLLDRLVDRFFNAVQSTVDQNAAARDGYEYLTVKVCAPPTLRRGASVMSRPGTPEGPGVLPPPLEDAFRLRFDQLPALSREDAIPFIAGNFRHGDEEVSDLGGTGARSSLSSQRWTYRRHLEPGCGRPSGHTRKGSRA